MLRLSRSFCRRGRCVVVTRVALASLAVALAVVGVGCGGYAGPPDIEGARQGISPAYRIVYAGEHGKTVLDLLHEHADPVVTEGFGPELLVTAINGIESGVEGRYWLYYVNEEAGLIAASRMTTVEGDSIEWLFAR